MPAQKIPPEASLAGNFRQRIRFVPARNAVYGRKIETKRPRNATLPPCRSKMQEPILTFDSSR